MVFRDLRADEVECRIGTVKEGKGVSLLLYKDARCDMNALDEAVGAMNWQKAYSRDNANCTVSIWDEAKAQWISKEDTGTESKTEAEKGLASDSFKRACVNWGIGRELYTAPFVWIPGAGKYDRFYVKEMTVENKKITHLVICAKDGQGNKTDTVAFAWDEDKTPAPVEDGSEKITETRYRALEKRYKAAGKSMRSVLKDYGVTKPSEITYDLEARMLREFEEYTGQKL